MKLIDIETGVEYSTDIIGRSVIEPTGKTYEVREMYGAMVYALGTLPDDIDTHKFLCFGELIEKPNPMPSIEAGDYVFWLDGSEPCYIYDDGIEFVKSYGLASKIFRSGKLLWSRENK